MDAPKGTWSRIGRGISRAYQGLSAGWRELLTRSSGALTYFAPNQDESPATESQSTQWSLLAAETWETAKAVIIRIEIPGMTKDELSIVLRRGTLLVSGDRRSGDNGQDRSYRLAERAYGRFKRSIPIPSDVDTLAPEFTYRDGVVTVILAKVEPTPPRQPPS